MKPLTIPNAQKAIIELQKEIQKSKDARYTHRLHAVLLVAQGMSSSEVAHLLGDGVRTVQLWVHRFKDEGLSGLKSKPRPGRPSTLSEEQLLEIGNALFSTPEECGMSGHLWDGKTLSAFISKEYNVHLGVRQCQRLLHKLGFKRTNEELEKKKLTESLEKHKGSIEKIERMSDKQREKFFEEFEKKDSSKIFKKYGLG